MNTTWYLQVNVLQFLVNVKSETFKFELLKKDLENIMDALQVNA